LETAHHLHGKTAAHTTILWHSRLCLPNHTIKEHVEQQKSDDASLPHPSADVKPLSYSIRQLDRCLSACVQIGEQLYFWVPQSKARVTTPTSCTRLTQFVAEDMYAMLERAGPSAAS
jgi:hypothetical protein